MSITRTGSNGTTQACAACKYQRKKCAPDCILAPYFPHDRQRQFLNAHKLFGVSNITKIIKDLNPPDKDAAMSTIIFQADARARDPIGGCYRIIRELERQIECARVELDMVLHQLAICRAQAVQQQQHPHMQPIQETSDSTLTCEIVNANMDPFSPYNSIEYQYVEEAQQEGHYIVNSNHHNANLQDNNVDTWGMQDPAATLAPSLHVRQDFLDDEGDDAKPVLEIPSERHEIRLEAEELVVEQRFVPSTQLVMSS